VIAQQPEALTDRGLIDHDLPVLHNPAEPFTYRGERPKPAWQEFVDSQERSSREDLASAHDVFIDSALEPVAMPRWLRGRRRSQREKRSRP